MGNQGWSLGVTQFHESAWPSFVYLRVMCFLTHLREEKIILFSLLVQYVRDLNCGIMQSRLLNGR